ncbi:CYTH domain-containing protein [Humitalea sp. 24SJ18S-53]|uniref:CYTH domain-containing protein n=1 Tax=Humitalea sp. 24SJ18S-53 TaxID=3422307 RepID=UPI003D679F59
MAVEIERKFLVASDAWRAAAGPGVPLRQGYLTEPGHPRGVSVRVRREGDAATLTVKGPGGLSRAEFETAIPIADAEAMLDSLCGPLVEKTRHLLHHAGHDWTVDVFAGRLAGLVLAEIELPDPAATPPIPPWAGREVTEDPRYRNNILAEAKEPPA